VIATPAYAGPAATTSSASARAMFFMPSSNEKTLTQESISASTAVGGPRSRLYAENGPVRIERQGGALV
jgi:hypothetical protein